MFTHVVFLHVSSRSTHHQELRKYCVHCQYTLLKHKIKIYIYIYIYIMLHITFVPLRCWLKCYKSVDLLYFKCLFTCVTFCNIILFTYIFLYPPHLFVDSTLVIINFCCLYPLVVVHASCTLLQWTVFFPFLFFCSIVDGLIDMKHIETRRV
jgi:hypothetical protein